MAMIEDEPGNLIQTPNTKDEQPTEGRADFSTEPKPVIIETSADLVFREVKEQKRIYHFGYGRSFEVDNIIRIANSKTTHRLETADGRRFIIPKTFLSIEIVGTHGFAF